MRLPIDEVRTVVLFELLDALEGLGFRAVLVGGLVPPLLVEALDPDALADGPEPRRTADCDLALDLAVADGDPPNDRVEAVLASLGWEPERRTNQFRWKHPCKLPLDLVPVPLGIELGERAAVEFARRKLATVDQPARFYRGYELALAEAIAVAIDTPRGARWLRIAGLTSFFAMKLEAWIDSYRDRKRDAYDIAWILRHTRTDHAAAALRAGAAARPDLVEEIVERLARDFADPWDRGVRAYATELHPYRDDDRTEGDRNAVASAVRRLLDAIGHSSFRRLA